MNKKNAIAIVVFVLLMIGLYYLVTFSHKNDIAPMPDRQASTTANIIGAPASLGTASANGTSGTSTTTKPPIKITAQKFAFFDKPDMVDTSGSPVITGIANVQSVDVLIFKNGVGVEAGRNIPVENGKWSYNGPKILEPGTYLVQLLGGIQSQQTTLTVK